MELAESVSIRKLVELIINLSKKSLTISHDITKPTIKTSLCLDYELSKKELDWFSIYVSKDGVLPKLLIGGMRILIETLMIRSSK